MNWEYTVLPHAAVLQRQPIARILSKLAGFVSLVSALGAVFCALGALAAEGPDQAVLTERFKSWTVSCVGQDRRSCRMVQELVQKKTGRLLSALIVEDDAKDGVGLTVLTPFGLLFSKGLQLSVDGSQAYEAGFLTCMPSGCLVPVLLDKGVLDRLRAGGKLQILGVAAASGKPVRIEFSLLGFSAALVRLTELSGAPKTETAK